MFHSIEVYQIGSWNRVEDKKIAPRRKKALKRGQLERANIWANREFNNAFGTIEEHEDKSMFSNFECDDM